MIPDHWSPCEKKIARRVFEVAVQNELAEIMAEFKARAASAKTPEDMWAVPGYLTRKQRAFDAKYDYRYSQLVHVFGQLLSEGRIELEDLKGIAEDKLARMSRIAALLRER